jgi:hypothetical protein
MREKLGSRITVKSVNFCQTQGSAEDKSMPVHADPEQKLILTHNDVDLRSPLVHLVQHQDRVGLQQRVTHHLPAH